MGQQSSLAVWSTCRGQEKHNTWNNGTKKAMREAILYSTLLYKVGLIIDPNMWEMFSKVGLIIEPNM